MFSSISIIFFIISSVVIFPAAEKNNDDQWFSFSGLRQRGLKKQGDDSETEGAALYAPLSFEEEKSDPELSSLDHDRISLELRRMIEFLEKEDSFNDLIIAISFGFSLRHSLAFEPRRFYLKQFLGISRFNKKTVSFSQFSQELFFNFSAKNRLKVTEFLPFDVKAIKYSQALAQDIQMYLVLYAFDGEVGDALAQELHGFLQVLTEIILYTIAASSDRIVETSPFIKGLHNKYKKKFFEKFRQKKVVNLEEVSLLLHGFKWEDEPLLEQDLFVVLFKRVGNEFKRRYKRLLPLSLREPSRRASIDEKKTGRGSWQVQNFELLIVGVYSRIVDPSVPIEKISSIGREKFFRISDEEFERGCKFNIYDSASGPDSKKWLPTQDERESIRLLVRDMSIQIDLFLAHFLKTQNVSFSFKKRLSCWNQIAFEMKEALFNYFGEFGVMSSLSEGLEHLAIDDSE